MARQVVGDDPNFVDTGSVRPSPTARPDRQRRDTPENRSDIGHDYILSATGTVAVAAAFSLVSVTIPLVHAAAGTELARGEHHAARHRNRNPGQRMLLGRAGASQGATGSDFHPRGLLGR